MRLGIVSDTHAQVANTREAVRMLESLDVQAVLHCGCRAAGRRGNDHLAVSKEQGAGSREREAASQTIRLPAPCSLLHALTPPAVRSDSSAESAPPLPGCSRTASRRRLPASRRRN